MRTLIYCTRHGFGVIGRVNDTDGFVFCPNGDDVFAPSCVDTFFCPNGAAAVSPALPAVGGLRWVDGRMSDFTPTGFRPPDSFAGATPLG